MSSTHSPVTLIVKTPNQKVKDITIECDLDWSVSRLKQHISQVYPGKPQMTEQKLIYAGRLLTGQEILKDILKHTYEEGQITHTVHLLCSTSLPTPPASQQPSPTHSSPASSNHNSQSPATSPSNEGLRHRHTSHTPHNDTTQHTSQHQHYAQYYGAAAVAQPHTAAGAAPVTTMPAMLPGMPYSPEQMMYFQQVYAQQMAQYMQYMQQYPDAGTGAAVTSAADTGAHAHHAPAAAAAPANGAVAGNGAVAAGGNQGMVMNAAGGQAMFDDDEEGGNRDWLDMSYMLCRFGVLLMIVYFYSSLGRFLLVFGFFMLISMYQAGYFRLARRNADRPAPRPRDELIIEREVGYENDGEAENAAAAAEPEEGQEAAETPEGTPAENGEDATDNAEVEAPHPGVLKVALSFFVTFFTSLIPAQPDAVNAN